jgi:small conductance mechanosensitive channel
MDVIISYLPSLSLAMGLVLVLWGMHWLLIGRHRDLRNERKFPRQIVMLGLSLLSVLAVILALPITESSRNRLIGLIGLLVSGAIAFSSANILANLMGGILLRITKPFRIGDFVRIGEHVGRVTERGLFDTEIQTESRELIALPNAYLINHPIITTRSSGAIVSATLSLGYDVHHGQAEPLFLSAAVQSGLEEPFVHIIEMGNFSVTYRVSGLLRNATEITSPSDLLYRPSSVLRQQLHSWAMRLLSRLEYERSFDVT